SPAGPPRKPASPSPAKRMRVPSSTPAGMLTDSVRSLTTLPEPLQDVPGSLMISPRPWQEGQVRSMVKNPCEARTLPAPPHVGQEEGAVPDLAPLPVQASHVTLVGTRICAVLPA